LVDYGGAAAELALKLKDSAFKCLIILACNSQICDLPQIILRKRKFYDVLKAADPKMDKWGMYQLYAASGPPETEWVGPYVHSKTWIFDDAYAIVGSANCQRRCYSRDSELVVGVADNDETPMKNKILFAHELRMALWRKHLGLHQENLWDPIVSAKRWKSPPGSATITPYDPLEIGIQDPDKNPAPSPLVETAMNTVLDPDGA
jgi:hypothetical protein